MYIFYMSDNKELIATKRCNLYQNENLVDEVMFLLPQTYQGKQNTVFNISGATVVLKYISVDNVAHSEILAQNEELYHDYLSFSLPVDSKLSHMAGTINLRLTVTKVDLSEGKQYVLHSSETHIEIQSLPDYYAFTPDESLEFVDQIVGKVSAQLEAANKLAEAYNATKADDLVYEDNKLQLVADGNKIGNAVNIKSCEGVNIEDDSDNEDEELDSGSLSIMEF